MKLANGNHLQKASGENKNSFYQIEKTANPVISEKIIIPAVELKETFLYDIPTQSGQVINFISKK